MPNEVVENPLEGANKLILGGASTPPRMVIVEYSAFWEVVFCSSRGLIFEN